MLETSPMNLALWLPILVLALILLWVVILYNGLVRARALVREGWSGISVQSTVSAYADHERGLLDEVTARRVDATKAANPADAAKADSALGSMLGRLMVVAEAYPDLKADANFRSLQDELAAIETELQGARRYYNATVRDLNTRVVSFPSMLVAGPLGFHEEPFFQDDDPTITKAPSVRFDRKS
jgi:LemA protein